MTEELKPCPFCNSTEINEQDFLEQGGILCMCCSVCQAFGPVAKMSGSKPTQEESEEAKRLWNKRA